MLIAAYTYLVGGDHLYDRVDEPGPATRAGRPAGIDIGGPRLARRARRGDRWLPRSGGDAIIGAGAVVVGEIPEFAIAVGTPAKVVRDRRDDQAPKRRCSSAEAPNS